MLDPSGYLQFRAEVNGVVAFPDWPTVRSTYQPRDVHRLFRALAHSVAPMRVEIRRTNVKDRQELS
jgi:hypothetical protein